MLKKTALLMLLTSLFLMPLTNITASSIEIAESADLPAKAEVIALAEVVSVNQNGDLDNVSIKIAAVIKGSLKVDKLDLSLQVRGGLKEFDPKLKVGQNGIFFLKSIDGAKAQLAYPGSIAIFPKPNFQVKEKVYVPTKGFVNVKIETSKGDIIVELNQKAAPITVKNFLKYVEEGFYNQTIFHRVIKSFMVQGGGMTANMSRKRTNPPIKNEASNGLKNDRGTIAMARTSAPDSATSQFFINHKDNSNLNANSRSAGYTVFGKVTKGMDIVDAIAAVSTDTKSGMRNVPNETITIISVTEVK
jgi:cyclophilin family peptidyl-prolyl cis-trans isomerase